MAILTHLQSFDKIIEAVFKPGALAERVPGFLKLLSCGRRYVCVCVSAPRAIKNHSREMNPE